MKFGTWVRGLVLGGLMLAVPVVALAGTGDEPASPSPFASAVKTTFAAPAAPAAPAAESVPMILSAGFSMVHYYETTYIGAYGTFGYRVTSGDYPVAIVAQFGFNKNAKEHPFTVMGGGQVTVMHNEMLCVAGRGLFGITHWNNSSTDIAIQLTGVAEIHLDKNNEWGINIEGGLRINKESDFTAKGFVFQAGVTKFLK